MSESFHLERPEHFTTGAVGEPGARTFYLQAAQDGHLVSIKCEKEQVRVLSEYLTEVLADLPEVPAAAVLSRDLVDPVVAEWTAGSMGVAYDADLDRIVLVVEELLLVEDPDAPPPDGATLRLHLERAQVQAFVVRAIELVTAGRPICPLCGQPIDPSGHACPRTNGHSTAH